jgi:hypothetical protein
MSNEASIHISVINTPHRKNTLETIFGTLLLSSLISQEEEEDLPKDLPLDA